MADMTTPEYVSVPREPTPEMVEAACISGSENGAKGWHEETSNGVKDILRGLNRKAYAAMLSAAPPAPAVGGDWYTREDTGTHIFDLDDDPQRQLSILLQTDGKVGFAAYVNGRQFCGDATSPEFRQALTAFANPAAQAPKCHECGAAGLMYECIACSASNYPPPQAPSEDVERQARELLALEAERENRAYLAQCIRQDAMLTTPEQRAIRAIIAALRRPASAGVVDDAMVERALDAAREASDARLPRYAVVRAILTAALTGSASGGDGSG